MKTNDVLLNPNELVQYLQKPARDFTREDLIRFVEAKGITMINFSLDNMNNDRWANNWQGLEIPDALEIADKLYVNYNIFNKEVEARKKKPGSLPASCWESAENLLAARKFFEKDGVFPEGVIDNLASKLKSYKDKGLSVWLYNKQEELRDLVREFLYCD